MANGGHLESTAAMLQTPIVREFLLKLIGLSCTFGFPTLHWSRR